MKRRIQMEALVIWHPCNIRWGGKLIPLRESLCSCHLSLLNFQYNKSLTVSLPVQNVHVSLKESIQKYNYMLLCIWKNLTICFSLYQQHIKTVFFPPQIIDFYCKLTPYHTECHTRLIGETAFSEYMSQMKHVFNKECRINYAISRSSLCISYSLKDKCLFP